MLSSTNWVACRAGSVEEFSAGDISLEDSCGGEGRFVRNVSRKTLRPLKSRKSRLIEFFFPKTARKNDILHLKRGAWLVFMLWAGADYRLGNVCTLNTFE
jgi:hypothetical protein